MPFFGWLRETTGLAAEQFKPRFGPLVGGVVHEFGFINVICMRRFTRKESFEIL
jgi:hypothetical protein